MKSLTKTERVVLVFKIIQEYLEKERYFNSMEILPYISSQMSKSSVDINLTGIKAAIKALIDKNLIVEQSKIVSKDVLSNKNRSQIYSFIQRNPGAYFLKIVNEMNLSIPVVAWHLNILERFNFIKKEKEGGSSIYSGTEFSSNDARLLSFLTKKKCIPIIEYLIKVSESLSINNISTELKIHRKTISNYLEKLLDFEIVSKDKSSYYFTYSLDRKKFSSLIENFRDLDDIKPWLELL